MHSAKLILVLLVAPAAVVAEEAPPDRSPHILCYSAQDPEPLARQVERSVTTLVVKPVGSVPRNETTRFPGETTFEIAEVLKDTGGQFTAGKTLRYPEETETEDGATFLLFSFQEDRKDAQWSHTVPITDAVLRYLKGVPGPDAPIADRLRYFVQFLEHDDSQLSTEAFLELQYSEFENLELLKPDLSRRKLRSWLTDSQTEPTRVSLYSLLLGLVGNADDASYLEARILTPSEDIGLEVRGIVAGYLMLTGEEGLDVIDREMLADPEEPINEAVSALQGLRFLWDHPQGNVSKDRLRSSMRLLLGRPELADLAISDLARWNDWSVADRLMELYNDEDFDIPSIKRAIVQYYFLATRLPPDDERAPPRETAARCAEHLAQIRKIDLETVRRAERFFFLVK